MKQLILLMFAVCSLAAQSYSYLDEATLSGTTRKLTIQMPNSPSITARFVGASLYCSVACTITLERSGGIATATLTTATKTNSVSAAAQSKVYTASNASSGTTINKYVLGAGVSQAIDLREMSISAANDNVSMSVSAITGDVKMFISWREQ